MAQGRWGLQCPSVMTQRSSTMKLFKIITRIRFIVIFLPQQGGRNHVDQTNDIKSEKKTNFIKSKKRVTNIAEDRKRIEI